MALGDFLAAYGQNDEALVASPWARAALGIAQIPDPYPTQNRDVSGAEAFLIPFARNAVSTYLLGLGRDQAKKEAYETTANNPLLKILESDGYGGANIGPVASGDEYATALSDPKQTGLMAALVNKYNNEMPADWNSAQGTGDLRLIATLLEDEQEKANQRAELNKALNQKLIEKGFMLGEDGQLQRVDPLMQAMQEEEERKVDLIEREAEAKARGELRGKGEGQSNIPELEGISEKDRPAAREELAMKDQKAAVKQQVESMFKDIEDQTGKAAVFPWQEASVKFDNFGTTIPGLYNVLTGREANDVFMKKLENVYPSPRDTKAVREQKKKGMIELLMTAAKSTPILDRTKEKNRTEAGDSPKEFLADLKRRGVSKAEAEKLYRERFGG